MQNKENLRKLAKDLRKNLDIRDVGEKILQVFINTNIYKNSENIGIYYPYGSEPNFEEIFLVNNKNFFLPKITANSSLTFHKYKHHDELTKNKYGILESSGEIISPTNLDLIVLPALMADRNGYRLGYGKGYYDRFFSTNIFLGTKIIFIPEKLFIEKLPYDEWDIPSDIIITEKQIYKIH